MSEIEKLKRHIRLMEDGRYVKIDDFAEFSDERKQWADQLGYWMQSTAWPLNFACIECEQSFDLHQKDLDGSHVDISATQHTGQPRNAYLPIIIGCKFCEIENVYDLVEFETTKGAK